MTTKDISNHKDLQDSIRNEKAVIVYFYNNHCTPCLMIRPKLEHLVNQYFPNFIYLYVNGEKHLNIQTEYNIFENPTILVFFEGKEFFRESKFISLEEFKNKIGRIYSLLFSR